MGCRARRRISDRVEPSPVWRPQRVSVILSPTTQQAARQLCTIRRHQTRQSRLTRLIWGARRMRIGTTLHATATNRGLSQLCTQTWILRRQRTSGQASTTDVRTAKQKAPASAARAHTRSVSLATGGSGAFASMRHGQTQTNHLARTTCERASAA